MSDAVSALLSASSLVSFAISTFFGLVLDIMAKVTAVDLAWIPFIIPVMTSIYLWGYGKEISAENKKANAPAQPVEEEEEMADLDINDALPN